MPIALALGLAAYLAVSGVAKLAAPDEFSRVLIQTYGIAALPATVLAKLLPAGELATGTLVAMPSTRPFGLLAAAALLATVASFAAIAWAGGRRGECGCFGILRHDRLGAWTVGRAFALLALAIFLSAPLR